MTRKIVVGLDGSEGSRRALLESIRLTKLEKAALEIVSVEELPRYAETIGEVVEEQDTANQHLKRLQEEARQLAREQGIEIATSIKVGHPAKGLIDYAGEAKIDLLVIGHSGHSGLWGSFLGTTADKVVRHAPCSVLIVR
ncbi:MAG: universal stress protein [Candidatus Melainabacteria bacterium]|nr:universal stress protein [Candidatus Melainabacteria bacterium]